MIREIKVSNLQSLRKMTVSLGRFTVITGPTGTGKSAFIRAVQLLAFNARGVQHMLSHGEKTCTVSATGDEIELTGLDDDWWQAEISRGGKNAYTLSWREGPGPNGKNGATFTKLAGTVPEQVTGTLRLSEVNFAGQHDMPFLLKETGSEVARVLGKLTNVTLLYKAAQEANRRRLASAAQLKTRQADLAALRQQVAQYVTLPSELQAVEAAEAAIVRVLGLERQAARLQDMTTVIARAQATRDMLADQVFPEPPALDQLEALVLKRSRLQGLAAEHDDAFMTARSKLQAELDAQEGESAARMELSAYLAKWSVCPTCGQPVRAGSIPHD